MTVDNSSGDLSGVLAIAPRRVLEGRVRQEAAPDLLLRLAEVAGRLPFQPAVESVDGSLSYAELVTKVAQTAHALRERGVGPGSLVGISLARGARELVTMLATLALDAAYVPLDPAHPEERLRLMWEDANPSLWVRDRHADMPLSPEIPVWIFAQWRDLPAMPLPGGLPVSTLSPRDRGDALAYVLFTSGSTGRPKGVEIRRRALESFLRSMAEEPGLVPGQRLLAVAPTSFDISGLELFLPLWVGGTTVIADRSTVRDPRAWAQALDEHRIDCLQATPSGWRLLLEAGWRGRPGLKMLCGGEPLTEALAARLLEKGEQLWNLYGPTETTVWSTLARIRSPRDITVGRPIDATAIAVVGDDGHLSPPDEEGEIVIGGVGLARGYRGRPDLTKSAFYHPSWAHDEARFYRTGDRGRVSAGGELVCLGRRDGQVKILGHRIELSEVETALRAAQDVNEVVVLAEHAQEKDARLVAYFQGTASATALLARARDTLPAYMVPARYVSVASFPLNANGKIDRRALALQRHEPVPAAPVPAAARDWETCIAALWAEILKRDAVAIDEDVFTLGATSLLAAEMQERLQALIGRPLPMSAVFEAPTPKALADLIEANATGHERIVIRLRSGPPEATPLFCLVGVAIYRGLAESLPVGRDVFALHVPILPKTTRQSSNLVEDTARHYVEALRRLRPHGPYALLGLCYGGIVAFEAARQLASMGETVESVTVLDALLPNARTIDWAARLRGHFQRLRHQPRQWVTEAWATARASLMAHAVWKGLSPTPDSPWAPPVDGPEADRAIASFARNRTPLDAPVLVVHARHAEQAAWARVAPDLGWSALAPQLRLLSLDAGHLDLLLLRPFVDAVARALPLR